MADNNNDNTESTFTADQLLVRTVIARLFGYSNFDDTEIGMFILSGFQQNFANSLFDITLISEEVLRDHTFKILPTPNTGRKTKKLETHDINLLGWFQQYASKKFVDNGKVMLTQRDWENMSKADFDFFRIMSRASAFETETPTRTRSSVSVTTTSTSSDFAKSIKRDKTHYTIFKEEKLWDQWHEGFIIQAKAHALDNILDESYTPVTAEDKELFAEQQKFMMSVLHYAIKTNHGKTFVREHLHDNNAQKIYAKLVKHHSSSTSAKITSSSILTYLVSTKYDKTWTSGTNDFILHWLNQARIYNDMVETSKKLHEALLLTLLQQAVNSIDDLRRVQTQDEIAAAGGGGIGGSFEAYKTLLLAAATRYDREHHRGKSARKQLINMSDRREEIPTETSYYDWEYSDTPSFESYESIDIDTPTEDYIQVNMANSKLARPGMRDMKRGQRQRAWVPGELFRELTDKQKSIMVEYNKGLKSEQEGAQVIQRSQVNFLEEFKDAREHEVKDDDNDAKPDTGQTDPAEQSKSNDEDKLLAYVSARNQDLHPADIRRVLSTSRSATQYRQINVRYRISHNARHCNRTGQLVDRGANGGVIGDDALILERCSTQSKVTLVGLDNHEMTGLPIVTAAGLCQTQHGPVIVIMNQYALAGKGRTIHSCMQIEAYKNEINDRARAVGGRQRIITSDGYYIPLAVRDGLVYLDITKPTKKELDLYPHVVLTADEPWDPSIFDSELDLTQDDWFDAVEEEIEDIAETRFDEKGEYKHRHVHEVYSIFDESDAADKHFDGLYRMVHSAHRYNDCDYVRVQWSNGDITDEQVDDTIDDEPHDIEMATIDDHPINRNVHATEVKEEEPDYTALRPNFGWIAAETIKKTLQKTTQYAKTTLFDGFRRHFKTRFPAANVFRRGESVATDYVDVGIPAIDDGSTGAQIFVGTESHVIDVEPVKSGKEFVNTLEDNIRKRGAMDQLVSDSARMETSKKVADILRNYRISDWQSEPEHQWQNPCERHYQRAKDFTNRILERTGAPAYCWLLCLVYVGMLLNHLVSDSLNGITPLEVLTGRIPDVSPFMTFSFYEPVYYKVLDRVSFPEDTRERLGYWVGIAENVGDILTYKVLDHETLKVVHRSNVRKITEGDPNVLLEPDKGENRPKSKPILRSRRDNLAGIKGLSDSEGELPMPTFTVDDLLGRSFLMDKDKDTGERSRGVVKRVIAVDPDDDQPTNIDNLEFIIEKTGSKTDEILTYLEVVDYINKQSEEPTDLSNPNSTFTFRRIIKHQGPLHPRDPDYKGALYNVMIEWETGEITTEPLTLIAADDPVTCAIYAQENDLLSTRGWMQFRRFAKNEKVFKRLIKQAKIKQFRRAPKFKYGVQIPYDYKEAVELDKRNGNTKWQDATKLEVELLDSFKVFIVKDKAKFGLRNRKVTNGPDGYQQIRARFVYDCKHDGRHRARFVAGGHLTDIPVESCYSGVVSMSDVRLIVFLAELNQLELWGADIASAYLLAETKEKVFFVADGAFGDREGHIMIIFKAQYGLRTSGVRWHDKLFDVLTSLGFQPSKIPDVYMRRNKRKDGVEIWEYVATYVDDLLLAMVNPKELIDGLESEPWNYKLRSGELDFHLGCGFERDPDGTLKWTPRKYIERMEDTYKRLFGEEPSGTKRERASPLVAGDHPELDDSELLGPEGITKYQTLIGCLQWLITLGRFDTQVAVMTMSRFAQAPREGHLERVKRIVSYVKFSKNAAIRVRIDEPDYSDLEEIDYDWTRTVYGGSKEQVPENAPEALGRAVVITVYVDANLEHCKLTGRAVTGCMEFVNQTLVGWYAKRQATAETATYGSEVIAARVASDRNLDLRTRLRYLGVPIKGKTFMFGDNKAVTELRLPHSKLTKRHHALNWHRVRESIAAGILTFLHIDGKLNPADVLSKHCGYQDAMPHLRPLLYWAGDTFRCSNPKKRAHVRAD